MGILDTALSKLSDPASMIAMGEDTLRDMRHRQENAMGRAADRVNTMWRDVRAQAESAMDRQHESGMQDKRLGAERDLQSERLGTEEELFERQLEEERELQGDRFSHESRENHLDRLLQSDLAENEHDARRQLQQFEWEQERLRQKGEQKWSARESELNRELEMRIAQLRASLERDRLSAQNPELAEQGDLLNQYMREVEKLRQTGYDWQWDPASEQYIYVGEDSPEAIRNQIHGNIDGDPRYTPEEREALKSFIDNNFGLVLGQSSGGGEGPDGGGSGRFGWLDGSGEGVQGFHGGVTGGNLGSTAREIKEGLPGEVDEELKTGVADLIQRLGSENLAPEDQSAITYAENELEGADNADLEGLLKLLAPLEDEYLSEEAGSSGLDEETLEAIRNQPTESRDSRLLFPEEEELTPLERLRRNRERR